MRLDFYILENNLADTRSKAQDLIKSHKVLVNGKIWTKPKYEVTEEDEVKIVGQVFVSRSGSKLSQFLKKILIDFEDATVLDVGASTGGFTEVALQKGAAKVYAIDVGTDQLQSFLKENELVVSREKTDIRDVKLSDFAEPIDIVLIDVSFISLKEVLPNICKLLDEEAIVIALFKPQFEVGKENIGAGGIVKDESIIDQKVADMIRFARSLKLKFVAQRKSSLKGKKGNQEVFLLFQKTA